MIIAAPMGDPNASITTPQPVHNLPMFAALGGARPATTMTFVSRQAAASGIAEKIGIHSMVGVVRGCRNIGKQSMIHNDCLPQIEVDPQTYEVRADGELLVCQPAEALPLAQRYFLF